MRTTLNVREEALELCRQRAEETGTSLGEVISEAVFLAYRSRAQPAVRRKVDLPVSGGRGLRPGVDLDDSAGLEDLMEGQG